MNDKYLHNIQVGDLVRIRSEVSGRLAIVLAIRSNPCASKCSCPVDVLLADKQQHFVMYELEKIA